MVYLVILIMSAGVIMGITIWLRNTAAPMKPARGAADVDDKKDKKKERKPGGRRQNMNDEFRKRANARAPGTAADDDMGIPVDDEPKNKGNKRKGAKYEAKQAEKAERAEQREAELRARQDAKDLEEQRRALEADEKASEAEKEAKLKAEEEEKRQEQLKKEEEEYQAMKAMFSVDDGGTMEDEIKAESQGLLSEFLGYIKETKVILVEQLATKFGLKAQDAIMRLKRLEEMGEITGVMDDRGKYIYVNDKEMDAVVKFIRQRGRVSITELSENSHKLIRLQSAEKKEEKKQEAAK